MMASLRGLQKDYNRLVDKEVMFYTNQSLMASQSCPEKDRLWYRGHHQDLNVQCISL